MVFSVDFFQDALKADVLPYARLSLLGRGLFRPNHYPFRCLLNLEYLLVELALLRAERLGHSWMQLSLVVVSE